MAILAGGTLQSANAASLVFNPSSNSANVGGSITETVTLEGLSSGTFLSAFDVSVDFNSSVLSFASGVAGPAGGLTPVFASGINNFYSSGLSLLSPGVLEWNLTSFEAASYFSGGSSGQTGSVDLGTIVFNTSAAGNTSLSFDSVNSNFTDQNGANISFDGSQGATITVNGSANGGSTVPEPTTIMLLSLGALGMLSGKRGKA